MGHTCANCPPPSAQAWPTGNRHSRSPSWCVLPPGALIQHRAPGSRGEAAAVLGPPPARPRGSPAGCAVSGSRAGGSSSAGAPSRSGARPGRPAADSSRRGGPPLGLKTEPRPPCREAEHSPDNSTPRRPVSGIGWSLRSSKGLSNEVN